MTVETYRYLMSALVQVFGALVALDVIFLVLRHQYLANRRAVLAGELGRNLERVKLHNSLQPGFGDEYVIVEEAGRTFEARDVARQRARMREVVEILDRRNKETPGNPQLIHAIEGIKNEIDRYEKLLGSIPETVGFVRKVMGLPAGVTVFLSVLLLCSDKVAGLNLLVRTSILAVLVSAFALYKLVRWAVGSFNSLDDLDGGETSRMAT